MKRFAAVLMTIAAAVSTVAIVAGQHPETAAPPDVVSARKFQIVDENQQVRATLSAGPQGAPGLQVHLSDADEPELTLASNRAGHITITIGGKLSAIGAGITVDDQEGAVIELRQRPQPDGTVPVEGLSVLEMKMDREGRSCMNIRKVERPEAEKTEGEPAANP